LAGRPAAPASIRGCRRAVLANISGGTLAAVNGRGAVIKGKGAWRRTGPVIVQVADLVGQRPMIAVVAVMAGIRQARAPGRPPGEEGGGDQKTLLSYLDSPEVPLNQAFGQSGAHSYP